LRCSAAAICAHGSDALEPGALAQRRLVARLLRDKRAVVERVELAAQHLDAVLDVVERLEDGARLLLAAAGVLEVGRAARSST